MRFMTYRTIYLSILALNEEFVSAEHNLSDKISDYVARVQEMARIFKIVWESNS